MNIAIYNPYLDTSGGGEKYALSIPEVLADKNQVDILLDAHLYSIGVDEIKKRLKLLHNFDLSKLSFIKAPFGYKNSYIQRLLFLRKYDYLFYLTDGSIFFSTAKNNFIHFQMPLEKNLSLLDRIKLLTWKKAIYNSNFTKNYIEKNWPIKGLTIYPPVDISLFKSLKKQKKIISVGFFSQGKPKKHEVLIDAFKALRKIINSKEWTLNLVGGVDEGNLSYLESLKNRSKGYEIKFYPNAPLSDLIKLYGESQIYWHAAGYGEEDPKKFEHFGISVVEAMAAGCVPVVINKGGLREIVENGISGYLWDSTEDLVSKTSNLIKNQENLENLSVKSRERSKLFSKDNFENKIRELIYDK